MDFLTSLPYWGIVVVVVLNALFVARMTVYITQDEEEGEWDQ